MTNQPPDPDLRELFAELRASDLQRTPSFGESLARAREGEGVPGTGQMGPRRIRRPIPLRLAWGGSIMAAAAATATLLLVSNSGASDAEFVMAVRSFSTDPAGGAWRSPTDGLLNPPGSEVLRTLPRLGGTRLSNLPGTDSRPNQL